MIIKPGVREWLCGKKGVSDSMVKTNHILFMLFVVCWSFVSCKDAGKNDSQGTLPGSGSGESVFELPEIPLVYTTDESRNDFLAVHYWNRFDFGDTALYRKDEVVGQAFADYLQVLDRTAPEVAAVSVDSLLAKACRADRRMGGDTAYDYFTGQLEHYLYDPDSPMQNDGLYLIVLRRILDLPGLKNSRKARPAYQYEELMRNRVGTPAAHLSYVTYAGQAGSLYWLKTDYVLLFFYDPDCPACRKMELLLAGSLVIHEMIRVKKLTLLALYTDRDAGVWRKHVPELPGEWLHAYDKKMEVLDRGTYSLRALPRLYLLDKDKKVMIKNGTFEEIENALLENVKK